MDTNIKIYSSKIIRFFEEFRLLKKQAWAFLRRRTWLYIIVHPVNNLIKILLDPYLIKAYKKKAEWDKPIPPFYLRTISYGPLLDSYISSGKNIYESLKQGIHITEKDINNFSSVLDFSVGSGRVFQYFVNHKNLKITGCDFNIDQINWLSNNYPNYSFCTCNFTPPLPFKDETFDLIYSVSGFTHFSEPVQFLWLQELHRTLKAGGVVLLSVRGGHAAQYEDLLSSRQDQKNLIENKFIFRTSPKDQKLNKVLNPIAITENDKYGYTFHSQDYISQNWSNYFKIRLIELACIDNSEDLVVLEKIS